MNRTLMAILLKFVMTFIAGWIVLGLIDNNPIGWILVFAVAGTALNYIIGDLLVLPNLGNLIASIGDGVMGGVTAYILDLIVPVFNTRFNSLIILALLIAVVEYFFHIYLLKSEKVAPW